MSFTLFLQSGCGTNVAGSTNQVDYYFDWGATPEYNGKYEVSFYFTSRQISSFTPTQARQPVKIEIDFGAIQNSYVPTEQNGASPTMFLGYMKGFSTTNGNIFADANANLPVILNGKPKQNNFQIRLRFIDDNLYGFIGTTAYVMSIHFRAVEQIPKMIKGNNQSFSLVLNTVNGTASGPSPNAINAIMTFNVDWSILTQHKGKFRLTSSFQTESFASGIGSLNGVNNIVMEWGCIHDAFRPLNSATTLTNAGAPRTQAIAIIRGNTVSQGRFGYSRNVNVPIYLTQLPTSNQFTVRIVQGIGGAVTTGFLGDYVLTLFFEAI